ncbi:MAG TPA: Rieske 2Fe-2S domain-containing protein [Candidatus Saccharimonadales bacterium]|nr:Rieske 2Fe-2S domain-containing protein [Candidatus Saccharimonadales bacterium]
MSFVRFAALSDIPPGRNKSLRIGLRRIVVYNVEGSLYALEDACAHMKAPLSAGRLRGMKLTCSWHGWTYDITSGRRTEREGVCVRTFQVKVENGEVLVDPAGTGAPGPAPEEDDPGAADDEFPSLA